MITVHHLGLSQSERVLWLMEELDLPYNFVKHTRNPILSPDSLKSVQGNITGKSPVIEDPEANLTLSESGAILDYIVHIYGQGKLTISPDQPNYPDFLYWYHFGNASLQTESLAHQFLDLTSDPIDKCMIKQFVKQRMSAAYQQMDDRLKNNQWLAGDQLTIADIMANYSCTTQRYWGPQSDLSAYPDLLRWLKDCSARPAYQRARQKGDPEMLVLDGPEPPKISMFDAGGVTSEHWKKKEVRK